MQDEELFVGGFLIRREDEEYFVIENTLTGETHTVTEKRLTSFLYGLWNDLEG